MDRTIPQRAARLLDFIGDTEVARPPPAAYDVVYGHNQHKLTKPITKMTLDELIEHQRGFSVNFGSSASGRYQFMRATLQGLKTELGLRGTQVFDADLQDRLGYHLLKRRGYDAWSAGKLTDVAFAKRLAMEWASFPVLVNTQGAHRLIRRGQSYYAGDGVNKALISPEAIERLLDEAKRVEHTAPAPEPNWFVRFINWLFSKKEK